MKRIFAHITTEVMHDKLGSGWKTEVAVFAASSHGFSRFMLNVKLFSNCPRYN